MASYSKEGARVFVSLGRLWAQNVRKTGEALFRKYFYAIVSTEDCGSMVDKGTGETAEFEMDLLRPEIDSPPGAGGAGDKKKLNLRKAGARIMRPDVVTSADQVKAGDILEFRLVRPKKRKERMQLNWKAVFADDEAKYLKGLLVGDGAPIELVFHDVPDVSLERGMAEGALVGRLHGALPEGLCAEAVAHVVQEGAFVEVLEAGGGAVYAPAVEPRRELRAEGLDLLLAKADAAHALEHGSVFGRKRGDEKRVAGPGGGKFFTGHGESSL